ncbi:MAG: family 43 glycosylhydrolase [Lachnospiraceae bacterium]|nr:family 43 glycosylhydrolase [Lachnospiraceae bacterium]
MKRWIAFLLAMVLCLGLSACRRNENDENAPITEWKTKVPKLNVEDEISDDETYKNYMVLEEEWEAYGIGDPHIMKYNGMYYLYVSTKGREQGIKMWCSENTYDWEYCGIIAKDQDATYIAYSPKVYYWNGVFYLYTTSHGQGLRILTSDSPTGPFVEVTEGPSHDCIDATIFIDDDGQWYMGHGCDISGVEFHKMSSPLVVEEDGFWPGLVASGTEGNYWSETGQIFKRDDTYFAFFSGNHVANDAYRTMWASSSSVLSGYTTGERPLLTGTYGEIRGTGCGLVFPGADLVSDYVVYHNLLSPKGPLRQMNIERLSYNGTEITAFGPTDYEQARGEMPTYYDFLKTAEGFSNVSSVKNGFGSVAAGTIAEYKEKAEANYVAEMNYHAGGGVATLTFSSGKGKLVIKPDGNMTLTVGGQEYTADYSAYVADAVHMVKIDYRDGRLQVYIDEMRKFDVETKAVGGKLAYSFEKDGKVGFTAITEMSSYDSIGSWYRPYAGKFFGKDYATEYSSSKLKLTDGLYDGTALTLDKNDYARYRINAGENTLFNMSVTYRASVDGVLAAVSDDGSVTDGFKFTSTDGKYVEGVLHNIPLGEYYDMLTLSVLKGSADIYAFRLYPVEKVGGERTISTIGNYGFTMMDGMWSAEDGKINSTIDLAVDRGNLLYGSENWGEYEVEVKITLDEKSYGKVGILLRMANSAEITRSKHAIYGNNDQGYVVYFTDDGTIAIDKHNYNSETVAKEKKYLADPFAQVTLKVKACGNTLTVYANGEQVLSYTDNTAPYLTGKVGLYTECSAAVYEEFKVKGLSDD